MNTLNLIKSRTVRNKALEQARKQMAKAFRGVAHTDRTHSELPQAGSQRSLTYRGVSYVNQNCNQVATKGRDLRYRGVSYGLY
jgi:hypothetical protein